MTREEAKSCVGNGWSVLIDHYFDMLEMLKYSAEVTKTENRIGMLDIKAKSDDLLMQDILNRLSWSIERDSAKVCEVCGGKGFRRKLLPNSPNRCKEHYVELMNEIMEQGGIPDEEV